MTLEHVNLDLTEATLHELAATRTAFLRRGEQPRRPTDRTPRRYRNGAAADLATVDRHACWLRMVGIVEIYIESLLAYRFKTGVVPNDPDKREKYLRAATRATANWDDIKKGLKTFHDLDVEAISGWNHFNACTVVRNTLAHGLGQFTANQHAKNLTPATRLLNVPARDGTVLIRDDDVTTCYQVCADLVMSLDAAS